jgi:non-homologous end joining protein Ku
MVTLLRYPYEVRSERECFDDIQHVNVTKDMLDLAKHIVNQKVGSFEPDKFEDQCETALCPRRVCSSQPVSVAAGQPAMRAVVAARFLQLRTFF